MKLSESHCDGYSSRHVLVHYQKARGSPLRLVLAIVQDAEEAPTGGAVLQDIDGDGEHEVELRGSCGAGPNCEGTIYRLTKDRSSMFHFFSGGYFSLRSLSGYLIESGRASCCSWEHHVYKQKSKHKEITSADMLYRVVVGVTSEGNEPDAPSCAFYDKSEQLVLPPYRTLLSLCEVYGPEYTLAKPQRKPN